MPLHQNVLLVQSARVVFKAEPSKLLKDKIDEHLKDKVVLILRFKPFKAFTGQKMGSKEGHDCFRATKKGAKRVQRDTFERFDLQRAKSTALLTIRSIFRKKRSNLLATRVK